MKHFFLIILYIIVSFFCNAQFSSEPFAIKTDKDSLRGELIVPDEVATFAVVIFVPGSGPTDRNGNSPLGVSANSYKLLATALAKQKTGTLLYDKRGIAESKNAMVSESELRFETYVQDVIALYEKIAKDKRVKKIIIAGHSEGSLIGMLAAQKTKADAYISIAGPAYSIDKIIEKQIAAQPQLIRQQVDSFFTLLKQDKKIDSVPPYLMSLFRPGIQPYIQSWLKYTPCEEIKKLTIPVLIIQGSTDIQVSEEEGKSLAACNPKAKFELINGMNHVLKNSGPERAENLATYNNASLPLNENIIKAITLFIATLSK